MTTIGYQDIEDVLLNVKDPNTGGAISEVPGVSSPKINGGVSVYNVEGGTGIAGWSTNVSWSASDYNTVAWSSGNIYLPNGTSLSVTSGNTGNMSSTTYIYYDKDTSSVQTTTSAQDSVGKDKILLCVANPTTSGKKAEFQAFGTNDQSTFIYASNIAANSITANEIASNTITASEISSGAVTADKISVSNLQAISADLGNITAGNITGVTITAGNTSSGAGIKLYPYTSNQGRVEFYYNGDVVGSMRGANVSNAGEAVYIVGGTSGSGYIVLGGNTVVFGKLRIPVGTDLYN